MALAWADGWPAGEQPPHLILHTSNFDTSTWMGLVGIPKYHQRLPPLHLSNCFPPLILNLKRCHLIKASYPHSNPHRTLKMLSDNLNATGLTANESRNLKPRPEREDEKIIISCLKELYTCTPTEKSYEMYAENATFHDPVTIATPLPTLKSQFNGMPKIFSRSTIDKFEVLESPATLPNPPGPDQFTIINQDVTYYWGDKKLKTVNSLLTLERDPKGKVIKHTEEWSHEKVTDKSDGFFGQLNEWRKKLAGEVIGKLVSDKPPIDKKE